MRTSHRIHRTHSESGIALLIAMFVLMLISAVAISLVISSFSDWIVQFHSYYGSFIKELFATFGNGQLFTLGMYCKTCPFCPYNYQFNEIGRFL